jgi:hypothetical protein
MNRGLVKSGFGAIILYANYPKAIRLRRNNAATNERTATAKREESEAGGSHAAGEIKEAKAPDERATMKWRYPVSSAWPMVGVFWCHSSDC